MIELKTPRGLPVKVPELLSEDPSPRFIKTDSLGPKKYYEDNGYVIFSQLFESETCKQIRSLWENEVKPFDGFMYRQATAKAERHVFNENNWVMNPILNLQSVNPRKFPKFRQYATKNILTNDSLHSTFEYLLGDSPKVVQSMYFEGNSATWEHQDTYYLDSEIVGEMAAAWIALEDITATAGRFFICPGSHKIKLDEHSLYNNIAANHEAYIMSVVDKIRQENLEIRAPFLKQGDVLFWNACTIHGSLDSQDAEHSRSSITCHAIPISRKFLQLQTRVLDVPVEKVNKTAVFHPKDQRQFKNNVILWLESHFSTIFYWLKRQAIMYVVSRK